MKLRKEIEEQSESLIEEYQHKTEDYIGNVKQKLIYLQKEIYSHVNLDGETYWHNHRSQFEAAAKRNNWNNEKKANSLILMKSSSNCTKHSHILCNNMDLTCMACLLRCHQAINRKSVALLKVCVTSNYNRH